MKVLFVRPNIDAFGFKPLNISLLSAWCKQQGWETKLFDTTYYDLGYSDNNQAGEKAGYFKPVDMKPYGQVKSNKVPEVEICTILTSFDPDVVAFSVLSSEYYLAYCLDWTVKTRFPKIKTIWGGIHPQIDPKSSNGDLTCLGDFLNTDDLDKLPFVDWSIFGKEQFYRPYHGKVYRAGEHMITWGCPNRCTYCMNSVRPQKVKSYSVPRIIVELNSLKNLWQLEFFKFNDQDFLLKSIEYLEKFGDFYRERVDVPFTIETNPMSVTEEKVKLLKDMGCLSASMGVETGSEGLRQGVLKRKDTEEDIVRAFSLLKQYGIKTTAFNMLGIPFESKYTYGRTVELNKRIQPDVPLMNFYYPFKETPLREVAIKHGHYDPNNEAEYHWDKPALNFPNLSEEELIEMRETFVERVRG